VTVAPFPSPGPVTEADLAPEDIDYPKSGSSLVPAQASPPRHMDVVALATGFREHETHGVLAGEEGAASEAAAV
jgi:hypothetical protein